MWEAPGWSLCRVRESHLHKYQRRHRGALVRFDEGGALRHRRRVAHQQMVPVHLGPAQPRGRLHAINCRLNILNELFMMKDD